MADEPPPRAVIYCRMSQDRTGEALGVARQEALCRDLCARRGWQVTSVHVENDTSASGRKPRPVYRSVLEQAKQHNFDVLVGYHLDRITRRPAELEELLDVCEPNGVLIATVAGDLDLTTADGKLVARMLGAVARAEVEKAGARRRAANDQAAAAGRPALHGPRAFGFEPDGRTVRSAEAALIRQAVSDLLAGVGLGEVARCWTAAGVPTPQGRTEWSCPSVRAVVTGGKQAGLRVHRRQVVGPGQWEPIVDPADRERLLVLFAAHAGAGEPPRRTPFSGLVRCGHCGAVMVRGGQRGRSPYNAYRCRAEGCGQSIRADAVEALVVDEVLAVTDHHDVAAELGRRGGADEAAAARSELTQIMEREEELAEAWAAGDLPRHAWRAAQRRLAERRRVLDRIVQQSARAEQAVRVVGDRGTLRAAWPAMTDQQRRTALHALVRAVEIRRGRKGPGVDLSRVTVRWWG